ncbi:histidinol dehydrogenase [Leptolyngbya sp. 7M]|uniref:histidinol dehydrogenase n=1 Tax=Leptolyngbya sp. 7M TaxID=2812896 RepID=UPI001B8D6F3C|nr:histidinol dehydrogenase [Leptolyngbya sp. 7M]QYO65329.1 histidinol dehydrogenase [Leptolyngbya sp. 7M]
MQVFRNPKRDIWPQIIKRPASNSKEMEALVRSIIEDVRTRSDAALRLYTKQFDGVEIGDLRVSREEFAAAERRISPDLANAIDLAHVNIKKFHAMQREHVQVIETSPGVTCWRKSLPIERVGLYIPAGTAPLFSTVLMLGVPAVLAGCGEVVICTPPLRDGSAADVILYAAKICGISTVYKVGGAQAIAAMAYGTETVPAVNKIFGPGNNYVTCAKQIVSMDVAIDMPAGPSEVAILADKSCNPIFVATDLLSQAEHGPDSQAVLVSPDEEVIEKTLNEIERQISGLSRREIIEKSLANSKTILVGSIDEGIEFLNNYAAEHLILAARNADELADRIVNAGSVFIGNYSCESAGDYASGTNHTLPTGGFSKVFSGVSLDSFVKKITFQKLTPEGIRNIGPAVEVMAAAEGLDAHKRAISVRLEELNGI